MLVEDPYHLKNSKKFTSGESSARTSKKSQSKVLQNLKTMTMSHYDDMFYAWECVSLVLENYTIDFVIKDMYNMMYFLHVLQHFTM